MKVAADATPGGDQGTRKTGCVRHSAQQRVTALTDEEVAEIAGRIDTLPAGGFVQVVAELVVLAGYAVIGALYLIGAAIHGIARAVKRHSS